MNPLNRNSRESFNKAVAHWVRAFRPVRTNRREQICHAAGHRYSQETGLGQCDKVLVNTVQLMVVSLSVALSYNRPRYKASTSNAANRGFARFCQDSLNEYVKRMKMEREARKVVLDGIFWMGVGFCYGEKPFSRVSVDDYLFDAGKGDLNKGDWYMHRYRVPLEEARSNPRFEPKLARRLEPSKKADRPGREEAAETISIADHDEGEVDAMVDLADVYDRRSGECYTWPCHGNFEVFDQAPLDSQQCERNPFRMLCYFEIPDNALPVSLIDAIYDNALILNGLLRKLANRAKKLRDIPIYKPGAEDDMRRAMLASDLEAVKVTDKDSIGLLKLFGLDQQLNAFTFQLLELIKQGGGNLDDLAGLAPTAETLGQSQEITRRVDQRIASYRAKTNEFFADVGGDIFEAMYHDPELVIRRHQPIPNTTFSVDASWWPPHLMERPAPFEEFDITIEPYSMEYEHPFTKFNKLVQALQVVDPLMQRQGIPFNGQRFLEEAADLLDAPQLLEFYDFGGLPLEMAEEQQGAASNAPHEYIRRNVSQGANSNGRLQQLMQQQSQGGNGGGASGSMQLVA